MSPARTPAPAASPPAVADGRRRSIRSLAAFLLLNALLTVEIPYPRMEWGALLRLAPESLGLLFVLGVLSGRGQRLRPVVLAALTAALVFLKLFQSADRLVPMIFNRAFNLFMDVQRLPDLVFLLWLTRPVEQVLLGLAGALAAVAAFSWAVGRALRTLDQGLAPWRSAGLRRVSAAAMLAGAIWLAAGARPGFLSDSALPRLAEEVRFVLELSQTRARHESLVDSAMRRAERIGGDLGKLARTPVVLVVVESYGMSALSDPRHAPTVLPALRTAEAQLQSRGFAVCSAYLSAPTFGGGSWLSHATLASGVRIESQIAHDLLLASRLRPLAEYFNRAGHRTVRVMPATFWPWPQGGFYRYERTIIAPDFDYRGPAFGFAPMPDQFVLDWFARRILRETPAPVFAEIILTGSHAVFDIQAPVLDDWDRIGDGAVFHTLAPQTFPFGWSELSAASPAYSAAISQAVRVLQEFILRFLDPTALVIIVGDHQPAVELAGWDQPWSVPVHVISGDPDLLREFTRRGYAPGMLPVQPPPHPGLETLFWDLIEGFSRPPREALDGG